MKNSALRFAGLGWLLAAGACQPAAKTTDAAPVAAAAARAAPGAAPAVRLPAPVVVAAAPPDSAHLVAPFVPAGYQVLASVAGDLNRDRWLDRVVVLDTTAEVSDSTDSEARRLIQERRRPLLLLLGEPGGRRYRLAARNQQAVDCRDCGGAMGGDPFQGVTVKNGYFSIESYWGSASRAFEVVTFKYQPADRHWYLHRVGQDSFHAQTPDSVTSTVQTTRDFGRVRFERYQGQY